MAQSFHSLQSPHVKSLQSLSQQRQPETQRLHLKKTKLIAALKTEYSELFHQEVHNLRNQLPSNLRDNRVLIESLLTRCSKSTYHSKSIIRRLYDMACDVEQCLTQKGSAVTRLDPDLLTIYDYKEYHVDDMV